MLKDILSLLLLALFITSCKDNGIIPSSTTPIDTTSLDSQLKIKWQAPHNSVDTSYDFSFFPLNYKGNVLINSTFEKDKDIFFMRDGETGELIWQWEDLNTNANSSRLGKTLYNNSLCYTANRNSYLLDLDIGQTIWQYSDPECLNGFITHLGNFFYVTRNQCYNNDRPNSTLIRTDLRSPLPLWEEVYTIYKSENDGYAPSIHVPALWLHPSGDSILLFQNRQINYSNLADRIDLYAFNLSQDSLLWRRDSITPSGNSSVQPPLVHEDKIYFTGQRTISCFDALSGDLIWENELGDGIFTHFLLSNILLVDGVLVVKNDYKYLHGLDPDTGVELWCQKETGHSKTYMVYYDGHVYFNGDGYLFKVTVLTGEIQWKFKSPNKDNGYRDASFHSTGVAIDPELKHLYTSDGYFIMCVDLE